MFKLASDTICALSTPMGKSAVAIIRLSGREIWVDLKTLFRFGRGMDPMIFGTRFVRPARFLDQRGELVDRVVVVFFPGPHSYTGEDVLEIQCHGSPWIVKRILAVLYQQGLRAAEAGEFTRRAFLNGKMDLFQVESVNQLIEANSFRSVRDSLLKIEGALTSRISKIRDGILDILVRLESALDFSEEDLDEVSSLDIVSGLVGVTEEMGLLVRKSEQSGKHRGELRIVLVGRPNVGKSTLFNLLVGMERSITSERSGTTRDYIEESRLLGEVEVCFVDTAGIGETLDPLEGRGMQRSLEMLDGADLVLFILDAADGFVEGDKYLQELIIGERLFVWNKIDLREVSEEELLALDPLGRASIRICGRDSGCVGKLREKILGMLGLGFVEGGGFLSLNQRQSQTLNKVIRDLVEAESMMIHGMDWELVAIKVREGMEELGRLTGENRDDEVLNCIFENFCIGK